MTLEKPKVSVVILNYNRWKDTVECVRSLRNCSYSNYEIFVFDNNSTDGSFESLNRELDRVTIEKTGSNLGYTGGINFALRSVLPKSAPYILLLNNDTIVESEFLDHLVDAMEHQPRAAAACGTICCYHNRTKIWYAGGHFIPWRGLAVHELRNKTVRHSELHGPRAVSFITGCMVLLKSAFLNAIGFEDERFFMYLDDIEFSCRISKKGFDLLYVPRALIYHKVVDDEQSAFKLYYSVRNRFLLIRSCTAGIPRLIATSYFALVMIFKLTTWRVLKPKFFRAAWSGLIDYFAGRFGQGRGFAFMQ